MRRANVVYATASARISDTPCLLHSITFKGSVAGQGVNIYDAHDANSEQLVFDLEMSANQSRLLDFSCPIPFERGMYIEKDTNCDGYTVVISKLYE